jgi:hypothetical protein
MKCGGFILATAISLLFSQLTVVFLQRIISVYNPNIGAAGYKQIVSFPNKRKKSYDLSH